MTFVSPNQIYMNEIFAGMKLGRARLGMGEFWRLLRPLILVLAIMPWVAERASAAEVPLHKFYLVAPSPEATLSVPGKIDLTAFAWVANDAIWKVTFRANGATVGISDWACPTCKPPPPGTPLTHTVVWENATPGDYELIAAGETLDGIPLSTEAIKIHVVDRSTDPLPESLPSVFVKVIDGEAHEGDQRNIAIFEIQRTGSVQEELTVHFDVGGSAQRGADYYFIPESMFVPCDFCKRAEIILVDDFITIPAGQSSVRIGVRAADDEEKETVESVSLELRQPIPAPNVRLRPTYTLGEPAAAKVAIIDAAETPGSPIDSGVTPDGIVLKLALANPPSDYYEPATIEIIGEASDRAGYFTDLDLYANGEKVGESKIRFFRAPDPGTVIQHAFTWASVKGGKYSLDVRTADGKYRSAPLWLVVQFGAQPTDAHLRFTHPTPGQVVPGPGTVGLYLEAVDPAGAITSVKFYGDDQAIGESNVNFLVTPTPGEPVQHYWEWRDVPAGVHVVYATATRADNQAVVVSAPVKFIVGSDTDNNSPVIRIGQPGNDSKYVAGEGISIQVQTQDPKGTIAAAEFFADGTKLGEESLAFPACVGCGPKPGEALVIPFTWKGAPPGSHVLTARARTADGQLLESAAVKILVIAPEPPPKHPADADPGDWELSSAEMKTYAAAWNPGQRGNAGNLVSIDIQWVTRAGYLWRSGGKYHWDFRVSKAPLGWVPDAPVASKPAVAIRAPLPSDPIPGSGDTINFGNEGLAAWLKLTASALGKTGVTLVPPSGGLAVAAEWVGSSGVWRWGPYYGDGPQELGGVPEGALNGTGEWTVSVDGESIRSLVLPAGVSIFDKSAPGGVVVSEGPRIADVKRSAAGAVELTILGGSAGSATEAQLEVSENLRDWKAIGKAAAAVATIRCDSEANQSTQRFYRLVKP